jgi:hypothetical protein
MVVMVVVVVVVTGSREKRGECFIVKCKKPFLPLGDRQLNQI